MVINWYPNEPDLRERISIGEFAGAKDLDHVEFASPGLPGDDAFSGHEQHN